MTIQEALRPPRAAAIAADVEFDPRTRRFRLRRPRPRRFQPRGPRTLRILQICEGASRDIRAGRLLVGTITGPQPGATPREQFRAHTWTWADVVGTGAQRCCDPKIQALNPHGAYEGTECGTRRLIDPAIQSSAAQVARALKQVGLAPRLDTVPPPTPAELLASQSAGLPITTVQTRAGHRFALLPPPVARPATTPAAPGTVTTAAGLAAASDTRALADRCTDRRVFQICEGVRRWVDQGFFPTGTRTETVLGESRIIEIGRQPVTWEGIRRAGAARCCDAAIQAFNPGGPFANTDCPRALVTPMRFRPRPPARAIPGLPKRRLVRLAPLSPTEVEARAPTAPAPPAPFRDTIFLDGVPMCTGDHAATSEERLHVAFFRTCPPGWTPV